MTLESGTFISDFNVNYPESNAPASGGDNHLRWIKTAVTNTFPNISGAVTATHTVINSSIATVVAATHANTANTLVQRDSSGNFTAGTITAALNGNVTGNLTGAVTATSLTVDTNTLHVDVTNNRVGIGTTSPSRRLYVQESGTGSSRGISINTATAGGNAGIGFATAGTDRFSIDTVGSAGSEALRFYSWTSSAERMRIDSSGRVGIGTTSPITALHIADAHPTVYLETSGGGSTDAAYLQKYNNEVYLYNKESAGSLILGTNNTERARIDSSGRVGIGTTSPSGRLHLSGDSDTTSKLTAQRTGSTTGTAVLGYNYVGSFSNNHFRFFANSSERMRIDSSGNVGIGTTSPSTAVHATGKIRAQKSGQASAYVQLSADELTSNYAADIFVNDTGLTFKHNSGSRGFVFDQNGTERMRINSSGDQLPGADASYDIGSTSKRYKDLHLSGEVKGNAQTASALTSSGETNLLLKAYPVGAIYISTVSTNPSSLFGGTWVAFGQGRVLVGLNSSDSDFNQSEETGGAKTNSTSITVSRDGWGNTQSGNKLQEPTVAGRLITGDGSNETNEDLESLAHASTDKTFSGSASTLQPYIVAYMFKRTA